MYSIKIKEVITSGKRAFAVAVGCQTYTFQTVEGLIAELSAYLSADEHGRDSIERVFAEAGNIFRQCEVSTRCSEVASDTLQENVQGTLPIDEDHLN